MNTKITTALAALLLAGASTAALAQDRDHGDRGDRQGRGQPQSPAAPAAAAPAAQAPSPQAPAAPRAAAEARDHWNGGGREGGFRGEGQRGGGFDRRNFQGQPPMAAAPVPQRLDRAPEPGQPAGRQWDHERGPREVIPPNGQRGWDGRRDGGVTGGQFERRDDRRDGRGEGRDDHRDGRWEGRDDRRDGRSEGRDDRRDGRGDARDGRWSRGERWQAGRMPPVFWSQNRFRAGPYRAPYGFYVRSWGFGEFLPRGWYGQDYWIGDFLDYDLPYPPPGYEWVRVGGDALMVDRFTGRVVQVVRGIFW